MRLNKYISLCGITSRRKADNLILQEKIKINDKIINNFNSIVKKNDKVSYCNRIIYPNQYVYILINKPKNCIVTNIDDKSRNTIMDLIKDKEITNNLHAVGRLDRNTTGLILLTNNGNLTYNLTHPSKNILKIYSVKLNNICNEYDINKIKQYKINNRIIIDKLQYDRFKNEFTVTIHSGQNRIIHRIFNYFGFKILKLDRIQYHNLNKQSLKRGQWKYISYNDIYPI
ncbi:MAG: rRNA pseudouridine synthase [Bacteroides sp.]|nr:MAG: rRNA pseudouridine synthase [Bacteroides sp.]